MGYVDTDAMLQGIKNWVLGKTNAKAGKPSGTPTNGNLAALTSNGDLTDSGKKASDFAQATDVADIQAMIPNEAGSANQLADKAYVNSSVATATSTFRGTYNLVSDLSLTVTSTQQQVAAALGTTITTADNNDYCFVQVPTDDATPTEIARIDRYKYNGSAWSFEYTLNNSGFTSVQWAAINSGITTGDVSKLSALPTNAALTTLLAGKQDVISDLETIRSGASAGAAAYQLPQTGIPASDIASGVIPDVSSFIAKDVNDLTNYYTQNEVDTKIATSSATYRGNFNLVNDLNLTISATHADIAAALDVLSGLTGDNNDYCFVAIPVADATPTVIVRTDRYKHDGTNWGYEFTLNNSGYSAAQWDAINSGATAAKINEIGGKYVKPASGIPESDLASAVQTSLGKADTALQSHQDISGKADKVTSATNGNLAGLDANGNFTDSGSRPSDFATAAQGTLANTAVQPSAIADMEVTTNKVTEISSQSTNTQYPSAKCVYDNLLLKQSKEVVVSVANGSGETYESGITIELGKFYDFSSTVGTYIITLPANSASANGESTLVFTTTATPNITFAKAESTDVVMIQSDFEFEASSTYEVNIKAINGKYYIVAVKEEVL